MSFEPGPLVAPERNRYFYGLLMDAERFQKDQDYFTRKLNLVNRFVGGSGALCGLDLALDSTTGTLTLGPGAAIDLAGREIIVPAAATIDPSQLTDDRGKPTGPTPAGGTVIISIAYAETCVDPVAVLVPDCDHPNGCAPSTIREGYAILVRAATGPAPPPPGSEGLFPALNSGLQARIAQWVGDRYAPAPADGSIALGRLTLPKGPLDTVSDRPVVYDNALLYQLIASLAAVISRLAGVTLAYVSGDNQAAKAGAAVPNPLVVALTDQNGNPVTGGTAPTFTVASGGGSIGPVAAAGPPGQYQATWTLGTSGNQVVTAQAAASPLTVTFHASLTK